MVWMLSIHPGYGSFQALITDLKNIYDLVDYKISHF